VTISSSNPSRVQDAVSRLQKSYPSATDRVQGHAANMGDEATLEDSIADLFEKTGQLDHVVYTAGDSLATIPIREATLAQIKQAGMVRFFAPTLVAKHASKYLSNSVESSITFTTGAVSERPIPGWSVVNGFATGLQGTTRGLALDLKPIRVNLVSPGAVDTELWAGMPAEQKQEMFKSFESKMTTGSVGQVVDVVEAFLYCMKDRNTSGAMISSEWIKT
jgi:NAD(P)-dependent dehydrogenase (short-subunit alcohol dehydrogenase family)